MATTDSGVLTASDLYWRLSVVESDALRLYYAINGTRTGADLGAGQRTDQQTRDYLATRTERHIAFLRSMLAELTGEATDA